LSNFARHPVRTSGDRVRAANSGRSPSSPSAPLFATALESEISWYFYTQQTAWLIDFTYPLLSTTAIYLTPDIFRELRQGAGAKRRQIRSAFSQYLSPALVEAARASRRKKTCARGEEREN